MKSSYYFLTFPFIYLFTSQAMATIELTDNLLLSAFGSTSVTRSDNETPIFLNRNINNVTCYDCDTTLGLQLDYQFLDNFTTSLQVVKRPQDEWSKPVIEWLYLGYNYKQYDIKIGRIRIPTFLDSEYYYVAHAYTPTRPPQEVYDSQLGVTFYDGLSFKWQTEINDNTSFFIEPHGTFMGDIEVIEGDSKYNFTINRMYGLKVELSSYNYRTFANVMKVDYDFNLAFSGIPGFIPAFTRFLASEKTTIYSLGGEYLWHDLTLRAETFYSDTEFNWYTQVAYGINKFTPYVSYSKMNSKSIQREDENETLTLGLRIDFTPTISINLEYQKMSPDDTTSSIFGKAQFTEYTPPNNDSDVNVYTLMVNFIL